MSVLMESVSAAHAPTAPGNDMRCFSRPSLPTVALSLVTSFKMRSFRAIV